jgi:hypothetical protein
MRCVFNRKAMILNKNASNTEGGDFDEKDETFLATQS